MAICNGPELGHKSSWLFREGAYSKSQPYRSLLVREGGFFKKSNGKDISNSVLKGQGHVTVNKPVISRICIVTHTWPLCSVQSLVDGANSL